MLGLKFWQQLLWKTIVNWNLTPWNLAEIHSCFSKTMLHFYQTKCSTGSTCITFVLEWWQVLISARMMSILRVFMIFLTSLIIIIYSQDDTISFMTKINCRLAPIKYQGATRSKSETSSDLPIRGNIIIFKRILSMSPGNIYDISIPLCGS
jgi:hypothetical protein